MGDDVRPRRILRGLAAGCTIVVSPAENLGYLLGVSEGHLQRAIRKYVKTGETVYDIGANIGYVSLSLSQRVGPSGKVYAFEPLPENLTLLRRAVSLSHKDNIAILDCAASDAKGTSSIRTTDNRSMASLVWHQNDPSAREYVIRTEAIDEMVDSGALPLPSFVKIDVEGTEGFVIRGMKRTIAAALPVIFIECSEMGRESTWQTLTKAGYNCVSAVTREPISEFEQYKHADFLWLPARLRS